MGFERTNARVHPVAVHDQASSLKPIDGRFVLVRPGRGRNGRVLELVILLRQLLRHASPHVEDLRAVDGACVLRHIGEICVGQRILNTSDLRKGLTKRVCLHRLGQTSHQYVLSIPVERMFVQVQGGVAGEAVPDQAHQRLFSHGPQELLEVQRVKVQQVHLADGKRVILPGQGNAQQAARRNHRVFGRLFTEVLQRSERAGARLHLVEEQQGVGGVHGGSRQCFYLRKKGCRRDVRLEKGAIQRLGGKVDVKNAFEVLSGERQDGIRLSHLACTVDNQGLPAYGMAPIAECLFDFSLHDALLS